MNLERELKQTLQRRRPPAGFTQRVMARLGEEDTGRRPRRQAPRWVPWAIAASLILAGTGGGGWVHQRQQQARAEQARNQILFALQVTGEKLDHVRSKVRSITNEEN